MKLRNGILACLLAALTLLLAPASLVTRAQFEQTDAASAAAPVSKRGYPSLPPEEGHAFLVALVDGKAAWENLITSEITVVVDVDFGTTRLGTPYQPNVLGSTSGGIFYIPPYSDVRNRLVVSASTGEESALYASLPAGASGVPTDAGTKTQMDMASPLARAFGAIAAHAAPNDTTGDDRLGSAPPSTSLRPSHSTSTRRTASRPGGRSSRTRST